MNGVVAPAGRARPPSIGILVCGYTAEQVRAVHGNYDDWYRRLFAGQGLHFRSWPVVDGVFPPSATAADGWLLTGSPLGVYEAHAFLPPLERFCRDAIAAQVPIAGICFGHQVIAKALGARVEKFAGGWQIGRQDYAIDGLGRVALNAWHQDQVLSVPEGSEIIATAEGCAIAGLRHGATTVTLQAHPEIDNRILRDLIAARRGSGAYREADIDRALREATRDTDAERVARWLAAFFHDSNPHRPA